MYSCLVHEYEFHWKQEEKKNFRVFSPFSKRSVLSIRLLYSYVTQNLRNCVYIESQRASKILWFRLVGFFMSNNKVISRPGPKAAVWLFYVLPHMR